MKNKLIQLSLFVIFISLIINPKIIASSMNESIVVFITILFPSIFPFFLISDLLINYNFHAILNKYFSKLNNFLFHTSNSSNFIIIMSMLSGFPSGSKYIKTLYDKKTLDIDKANYLITFTHFANPLFVLTLTRKIFINSYIPYIILFSHIFSNIIIGIIIRPKKKEIPKNISFSKPLNFSKALENSITNSINLLIIILGNTCLFFYISNLFKYYLKLDGIKLVIINGFFDITKGINSLNNINSSNLFNGILILSFLAFGGINIHMQVLNIIGDSKINYKNFIFGRISQLAISITLFYTIYKLI